jgi:type II secretory pathway pseudopilin PulG
MIGVIAVIIIPKLGRGYDKTQVTTVRARLATLASRARAVALARSCIDTLHVTSGASGKAWITVCAPNGSGLDTVGPPDSLAARYTVILGPADRNFVFDTRGMNSSGGTISVSISKNSTTDSVVVDALGRVIH